MIKIYSTISETGTDEDGKYWSTSYSRSRNNDIMDNFRMEFFEKDDPDSGTKRNVVTIKLGTINNMAEVITHEDVVQIDEQYAHLIGAALDSLQKVFHASEHLI